MTRATLRMMMALAACFLLNAGACGQGEEQKGSTCDPVDIIPSYLGKVDVELTVRMPDGSLLKPSDFPIDGKDYGCDEEEPTLSWNVDEVVLELESITYSSCEISACNEHVACVVGGSILLSPDGTGSLAGILPGAYRVRLHFGSETYDLEYDFDTELNFKPIWCKGYSFYRHLPHIEYVTVGPESLTLHIVLS